MGRPGDSGTVPEDTGSNPLGTVIQHIISSHQSYITYIVMEEEEEGLYSQLVSGGEGSVSVGMSLVISSGFGFNRITCVYAEFERRKSTESSSKTSASSR